MTAAEFLERYALTPESVDAPACLEKLLADMHSGLSGEGNIPMIPSYLPLDIPAVSGMECCAVDAGGTNLRTARASFDSSGKCTLSQIRKMAMPGTCGELTSREFYGQLAEAIRQTGSPRQVGLCFSYNVSLERSLDGILDAWCKEVRVPDAPGKYVGASLQEALGQDCSRVHVLNDSTAALLGAHSSDPKITVGLILGTGINICYAEPCSAIPKLPSDIQTGSMIISTEIGEFRGIPKNIFEERVIAASDDPMLAHGEKQCAGAYLGQIICLAWQKAAQLKILPEAFSGNVTLPQISDYLAGRESGLPEHPDARMIAQTMIHRAAKIAAVLSAGAIVRSCPEGEQCTMVIEGSQFTKLTGFGSHFLQELEDILLPGKRSIAIAQVENSCLLGAAAAAFAEKM
ncbi:MAG: hypothetical protein J6V25_06460 [Oscillospiraceae bacterium]|nr:hypothetical protein [Oscillospiraceae bacterium]